MKHKYVLQYVLHEERASMLNVEDMYFDLDPIEYEVVCFIDETLSYKVEDRTRYIKDFILETLEDI